MIAARDINAGTTTPGPTPLRGRVLVLAPETGITAVPAVTLVADPTLPPVLLPHAAVDVTPAPAPIPDPPLGPGLAHMTGVGRGRMRDAEADLHADMRARRVMRMM